MVDAVLEQTCRVQRRVRDLPARVVVYLLLAGCLFAELGYPQVWHRLSAGLDGLDVAAPTASAITQARRRLGPGPLRELFFLLRGPSPAGARWRGLLVVAIDGTIMSVADSAANLAVYSRQRGGRNGDSGYPMLRLLALVSCGTRTVIDAVFRPVCDGETAYFELKSTILGGRVLRARTPEGIEQEIYALLVTYQTLRTAIADAAAAVPGADPDRASFAIALKIDRTTYKATIDIAILAGP
jgi:Insertion element 4 transposase N-terminal